MKYWLWKYFMIAGFVVNILIATLMLTILDGHCNCSYEKTHVSYIHIKDKEHKFELLNTNISTLDLSKTVAFVLRDFESYENDIPNTIKSIRNVLPSIRIYIISDNIPYPPFSLVYDTKEKYKIIILKPTVGNPLSLHQPLNLIDEEHIFVIPDAVRLSTISQIHDMLRYHFENPHHIIAAPLQEEKSLCFLLNVSLRYWTMKFKNNFESSECNALQGKHILLVAKSLLMQLSHPFSRPFSYSLFIQATLLRKKIKLARDITFKKGKELFTDEHNQWKSKHLEAERKTKLHDELGIKKIIYPASKVEWHGCNKNTNRCFGTVVNNMPEYLFHGRWTPPCCLENLRLTARYVFGILEKCNVRYWLEGGSLLGAVRTGDIIPWDYDVDIGIYREDIAKCEWLKNSLQQSIVDTQGFVWEKATEGDFIRVQFSQLNHLHVDIFPFYSRNGTMTKDTWFVDHKQDAEFPEHFLKPLYKIQFVGVTASAQNQNSSLMN